MKDLPSEEEVVWGTRHARECMALAHHIALSEDTLPSLEAARALDAFFDGLHVSKTWDVAKSRMKASISPVIGNPAEIFVMRNVIHYYERMPSSGPTETGGIDHPWADYVRLLVESAIQDMMRLHAAALYRVQAKVDEVLQGLADLGEGLFDLRRGPLIPLTTAEIASLYPLRDGSSAERRNILQDVHAARHILHSQMHEHIGDVLHDVVQSPSLSLSQESTNEWNNILLYLEDTRRHIPLQPNVKRELDQWKNANHLRRDSEVWKSAVRALLLHAQNLMKGIEHSRVSHLISPLDNLLRQPFLQPSANFHYRFDVPIDRRRPPGFVPKSEVPDRVARFRSWPV